MSTWGDLNSVSNAPGGIFNRMTRPSSPVSRANVPLKAATSPRANQPRGDDYYRNGLWEEIQNETRKPRWYQMQGPTETAAGNGLYGALDEASMNQHGLTSEWRDESQSQSYGEGGTVDTYRAGNYLTPDSVARYSGIVDTHNQKMGDAPLSKHFGKDWRSVTEHDKYKVLDPRAVVWDDNLGWITHKKNYNPDGGKSWWQRNAATALPAIMGTLLGGPAGMAIGLGTAGVRAASGQTAWTSLLPAILSAGLNLGGITGGVTNALGRVGGGLANAAIRQGGNMAISNLTRRGRRG